MLLMIIFYKKRYKNCNKRLGSWLTGLMTEGLVVQGVNSNQYDVIWIKRTSVDTVQQDSY